jgi:hypothetical protein
VLIDVIRQKERAFIKFYPVKFQRKKELAGELKFFKMEIKRIKFKHVGCWLKYG